MKYKIFIASIISIIISIFIVSYSFATNDNIVQDIRNTVGGAENAVEDIGGGIASGIRNITGQGENMMENMANTNTSNYNTAGTTNYNATRTATANSRMTFEENNTFLGISPSMWTWIIMGIVGITIVALVWNYGKQYSDYEDNN